MPDADCRYCWLEGPDSFGNYDLIENDRCPVHGEAPPPVGQSGSVGILPGGFFARLLKGSKDAA